MKELIGIALCVLALCSNATENPLGKWIAIVLNLYAVYYIFSERPI